MSIIKSDILGNGYGSNHIWRQLQNTPLINNNSKLAITLYHNYYYCVVCQVRFIHYYDVYPDIFNAMKMNNVIEHCKSKIVTNVKSSDTNL